MSATLRLVLVWFALLALLAVTVGATFLPLGPVLPAVSYGIALAKALLVAWFFMDMRREGALARLAVATGFLWLLFLLTLTFADFASRAAG
jgi:cytochrome c oxidase subunit 4